MSFHPLKIVRVLLALCIFIPLLLLFVDFAGVLPDSLHALAHIQLVPAILSGSVLILIVLGLLTLFFGRVYCSVICPLGILQDIFSRFTGRGKKKNKKKRWYHYSKPYSIVRYTLLGICIVFLIFGITAPTLFLDPYSNFGRIAVNIFRPAVMEGNNVVNWIALKFDNYNFYQVTIYTVTVLSFTFSLAVLLLVGFLALLRGRLYCNTICPVGSLLGLASKFALFRIDLDKSKCTSCGLCEKACKSECIDSKNQKVDHSRCVSCFNCLNKCKKHQSISFRFALKKRLNPLTPGIESELVDSNESPIKSMKANSIDKSRRSFIVTTTAIAATAPIIPAFARKEVDVTKLTPITPPGSISLKRFKDKCTGCHLCITHCPQQVLKPAGFEFGLNYTFKPHMVFYEKGFCNYECTICTEICPNGAIQKLSTDEKKVTQVGIAKFIEELCIVISDGTSCGACSEHCPVQAVRMEPYRDGLTLPHVYEELCIGCGGCESICPVRPIKAINILANEIHQKAELPVEEEEKPVNLDDLNWGF